MNISIQTPVEGMGVIQDILIDRSVAMPDDIRAKLRELVKAGTSAIVGTVEACELIYARRDDLPAALLEVGAQLAIVADTFGFHGMRDDDRAKAIAATIRTMDVVASDAPAFSAPEAPPEPKTEYAPAPPALSAPVTLGQATEPDAP